MTTQPASLRSIFVGDLSYFSTADDIIECFKSYGFEALNASIRRGKSGDNLQHGFVDVDAAIAEAVVTTLHGVKFAGRKLRVNFADMPSLGGHSNKAKWFQIHVSFVSDTYNKRIDEEFLDRVLSPFAEIADIHIKKSSTSGRGKNSGYGFIYCYDLATAERLRFELKGCRLEGVLFDVNIVNRKATSSSSLSSMTPRSSLSTSPVAPSMEYSSVAAGYPQYRQSAPQLASTIGGPYSPLYPSSGPNTYAWGPEHLCYAYNNVSYLGMPAVSHHHQMSPQPQQLLNPFPQPSYAYHQHQSPQLLPVMNVHPYYASNSGAYSSPRSPVELPIQATYMMGPQQGHHPSHSHSPNFLHPSNNHTNQHMVGRQSGGYY